VDAENKGKSFGVGGYRGRIIFLGDGTEVLTDSDDTEMFDNADEDKDLESQVSKTSASNDTAGKTEATATETSSNEAATKPVEDKSQGSETQQQGPASAEAKKD
jgi:protein phosphatase PTC2/3